MSSQDRDRQRQITEQIKRQGLRMTNPRKVIIDTLAQSNAYLTAEEIYQQLHSLHSGIGLATVYRTMVLFHRLGIVTKVEVGEGKARYELVDPEHHHLLVCDRCHKVMKYSDFTTREKDAFAELERLVEQKYRYKIDRHLVQYIGICPECLADER